jgi:hypothetical protein
MKLKAAQVLQLVIVAKAIREGKLEGNQVAGAILSELVDLTVEGKREELDVIKVLIGDIDNGFLGGLISSILKRFGPKESDDDKQEQSDD